jgi:hypothetical protein
VILTICIRISTDFFAFSSENILDLESAKSKEVYGNIWVALATNIGTRYKGRTELPARSYETVIEVSDILGKEDIINDEILRVNMLFLQDYLNLMKTDLNGLLQNGSDRKTALETLITQLELRYKNAAKNLQTTITQTEFLKQKMQSLDGQINALKTRINEDFKNADTVATIENKNEYLRLKSEWMEARTYIIYFNQFAKQYNFLNTYNKQVLDTLINNKDVITKNSYVVLPDSGTSILKDLNLILDESEYKASEKKIEN